LLFQTSASVTIRQYAFATDWQRVDEAFQAGRVSDEIFPGWKVPTYYEAQQKADDVIRRQFERARREYGND